VDEDDAEIDKKPELANEIEMAHEDDLQQLILKKRKSSKKELNIHGQESGFISQADLHADEKEIKKSHKEANISMGRIMSYYQP